MRDPFDRPLVKAKPVHPYHWLWEPLESDPSFAIRPMFGGKAAYLDGKLMLYFTAKKDPWQGVLACTDRAHHASLQLDFPDLLPHPILPKWLYLSESTAHFERTARRLVGLVRHRDARLGVPPRRRKRPALRKPTRRRTPK